MQLPGSMSRLLKLVLVMTVAAVASVAIAACGDDDSPTAVSTDDTSTATTTAPQENGGGGKQEKEGGGSQGKKASGNQSNAEDGSDGSAEDGSDGSTKDGGDSDKGGSEQGRTHSRAEVETPLKVSGGGSTQFIHKYGDNSIAEYGDEADESELQEAAEIVHNFYVARAVGDWPGACSYLSKSMHEQFEKLTEQSEAKGCPAFLDSFTEDTSPSIWKELTDVDAVSLRHDGEQAFLIYRGAEKKVYAMPLHEEDGEWKATALAAVTIG